MRARLAGYVTGWELPGVVLAQTIELAGWVPGGCMDRTGEYPVECARNGHGMGTQLVMRESEREGYASSFKLSSMGVGSMRRGGVVC